MDRAPRHVFLGPPLAGKTQRLVALILSARARGLRPDQILALTFQSANAAHWRARLAVLGGEPPAVLTLQNFERRLLGEFAGRAQVAAPVREISATARLAVIRRAWQGVAGPLWREFGDAPGAVSEAARALDWISANRQRFRLRPGELAEHELARTYQAFIEACVERQLVTFQELNLRALDLLAEPDIAAEVQRRWRLVLVDDLHLARPDQLAGLLALCGPETEAAVTAWLPDDPHAPELRRVRAWLAGWDAPQTLSPQTVNPAVSLATRRLTEPTAGLAMAGPPAAPLPITEVFSAEDEIQALAQALLRAFTADPTLAPEDVLVVAADANLASFAERALIDEGLPVQARPRPARHSPLVLAGLLALNRGAAETPDPEGDRALLSLPFNALDPLDADALLKAARLKDQPALDLEPEAWPEFQAADTRPRLAQIRAALAAFRPADEGRPGAAALGRLIQDLGALRWVWETAAYPRPERDEWLSAWAHWLERVRELAAVLAGHPPAPDEWAALCGELADQEAGPAFAGGLPVVTLAEVYGHQARQAYVIGLSESATPALRPELQLCAEADLPALFADGRSVVRPAARAADAWLEREARALALALTRGREHLALSVSRHSAAGDQQLPTPFFERLLGAEGEIDRDGRLKTAGLFAIVEAGPGEAPAATAPAAAQPIQTVLARPSYSASQVRRYLACPLQYYFARVLDIEEEGQSYFERGSFVHEVLCAALGDGRLRNVDLRARRGRPAWLQDADRLAERTLAALHIAWTGQPADLPGGGRYAPPAPWQERFGPRLQQEATRRWAEQTVRRWAAYETAGLPEAAHRRPVLLEADFDFELDGCRLRGRIDRIDEIHRPEGLVYEVIDYKTGAVTDTSEAALRRKFLPEAGEAPADYQLPIYAFALESGVHGLSARPAGLRLIGLEALEGKTQKDGARKYPASASRLIPITAAPDAKAKAPLHPAELAGPVRAGLTATLQAMAVSPYPARPDYQTCGRCSFKAACHRGQGVTEGGGA